MISIKIQFGLNKRMHLWRGNFGGPRQVHFCILVSRKVPALLFKTKKMLCSSFQMLLSRLFKITCQITCQNYSPTYSKTQLRYLVNSSRPYCAHNEVSNNKSSYCWLFVEAQYLRKNKERWCVDD